MLSNVLVVAKMAHSSMICRNLKLEPIQSERGRCLGGERRGNTTHREAVQSSIVISPHMKPCGRQVLSFGQRQMYLDSLGPAKLKI